MVIKEKGSGGIERILWVYGPNEFKERQEIWKLIKEKAKGINTPWICAGDFNDFLYHFEKGGGKIRAEWKMGVFKQLVEDCELIDLKSQGQNFTWMNKREEGCIREKIDRVLANLSWVEMYPRAQVVNLPIIRSDHSPVLIDVDFRDIKASRQFKFEIIWTEREECGQIIRQG
ncbi:hypothetical protein DITRI_Ditri06bG0028900 [Diplodiscus trichospermus]